MEGQRIPNVIVTSKDTTSADASQLSTDSESNFWFVIGGSVIGAVGTVLMGVAAKWLFQERQKSDQEWLDAFHLEDEKDSQEKEDCIYLDYNGTTPVYPDVLKAMLPYLTRHYGNPSSSHKFGQEPRRAIDQARRQILQLLKAPTEEAEGIQSVWFTGCGTESDNLAIQVAIRASPPRKQLKHIVTCNVEHQAIEAFLKQLEAKGVIRVTYVPVQPDGCVRAKDVMDAMTSQTVLVTIMLANNESGALQPIREIATHCRKQGVLMHTDAAQAAGKVSCALEDLGFPDMVSLAGHKLGAPKGIAALYVRPGCLQEQGRKLDYSNGILLVGGGQEFGRRAGTENTPYIVGMGHAAQAALSKLKTNAAHMEDLRTRLLTRLQEELGADNVRPNGPSDPQQRLPNTLSVGIRHVHSGDLLGEIGHQVAASAGATCHSAGAVSSVLQAMQVPEEFARGTLRLSVGPVTTREEINAAARILVEAVQRQWKAKGVAVTTTDSQ